ncbi:hypothetical protein BDR03DRAFT_967982 [Suillus americanus]|nr:hypothetical protein BDR03DRAFT_967982 [Suillus americanus]
MNGKGQQILQFLMTFKTRLGWSIIHWQSLPQRSARQHSTTDRAAHLGHWQKLSVLIVRGLSDMLSEASLRDPPSHHLIMLSHSLVTSSTSLRASINRSRASNEPPMPPAFPLTPPALPILVTIILSMCQIIQGHLLYLRRLLSSSSVHTPIPHQAPATLLLPPLSLFLLQRHQADMII